MKFLREVLAALSSGLVLMATTSNVEAMPMYEPFYQEAEQAALSASGIENIVSPIALYPDQLIAQILGAATYPDQVTAASNFVNSSGLKDQALMQAVDKEAWDPSVKALTQFPTVLDQMAKNLAWTSALGDAAIGPMIAEAAGEGYSKKADPFHGYYFRVLTAQGAAAPGGAKSYIIDGKMTKGFAFVAYPAEYRNSGVMTFVVNLNGVIYEKDLGPKTEDLAKAITAINPDNTWRAVSEPTVEEAESQ